MEKQNFLTLGGLVRGNNKLFLEDHSLFQFACFFINSRHNRMVERYVIRIRLKTRNALIVFSKKELESVAFVKEEFFRNLVQKKKDVYKDLTTKSMRGRWCEKVSMEACDSFKGLEKIDKVCS